MADTCLLRLVNWTDLISYSLQWPRSRSVCRRHAPIWWWASGRPLPAGARCPRRAYASRRCRIWTYRWPAGICACATMAQRAHSNRPIQLRANGCAPAARARMCVKALAVRHCSSRRTASSHRYWSTDEFSVDSIILPLRCRSASCPLAPTTAADYAYPASTRAWSTSRSGYMTTRHRNRTTFTSNLSVKLKCTSIYATSICMSNRYMFYFAK